MAEAFIGKFKLTDSKNFDEYMKALGVNAVTRTLANKATPTIEVIIAADGTWTIKTISTVKNTEIKFKLGEEFEETSLDGRKCKTKFHLENGKLCQHQKATKAGEKDTEIEREIRGNDMIVTMPLEGITCVRTYTRQ